MLDLASPQVRLTLQPLKKHALELFICGLDDLVRFQSSRLTDIISISDAFTNEEVLPWFNGNRLSLHFGDVTSEADARQCLSKAPTVADIQNALTHVRKATAARPTRLLVQCSYGASRSPALAYVILADHLGPGKETEALGLVLGKRPQAIPNQLVVRLGEQCLERNGALLAPLNELYAKMNQRVFARSAAH